MILPADEPVRFLTQEFLRRASMENEGRGGSRPKPTGLAEARQGNLRSRVTPHSTSLSRAYSLTVKTRSTSEAASKGGRAGSISKPEGLANVTLGHPLAPGSKARGPDSKALRDGAGAI